MKAQLSLVDFLRALKGQQENNTKKKVLLFISENQDSCLQFVTNLMALLKKMELYSCEILDVSLYDTDFIFKELGTLFLGEKKDFWIHTHHESDKRKKDLVRNFLSHYGGPHRVVIEEQNAWVHPETVSVSIPALASQEIFIILADYYGIPLSRSLHATAEYIFREYHDISINHIFSLLAYCMVAGKHISCVIDTWFPLILPSSPQLFSLSHHFFAKDTHSFLVLWQKIKELYSINFWPSFWADHMWKASLYVACMMMKNEIEARRFGYRLPFIFTKKLWRQFSLSYLCEAHHALVDLNSALKTGSSEHCLELFYYQFLAGDSFSLKRSD